MLMNVIFIIWMIQLEELPMNMVLNTVFFDKNTASPALLVPPVPPQQVKINSVSSTPLIPQQQQQDNNNMMIMLILF
jgi:hypothetical protein